MPRFWLREFHVRNVLVQLVRNTAFRPGLSFTRGGWPDFSMFTFHLGYWWLNVDVWHTDVDWRPWEEEVW